MMNLYVYIRINIHCVPQSDQYIFVHTLYIKFVCFYLLHYISECEIITDCTTINNMETLTCTCTCTCTLHLHVLITDYKLVFVSIWLVYIYTCIYSFIFIIKSCQLIRTAYMHIVQVLLKV